MVKEKKRYSYSGAILQFENVVMGKWEGETVAVSESQARSNLTFQAKQSMGLVAGARIKLPGKIICLQ